MNTSVIKIFDDSCLTEHPKSRLSFLPLVKYLKERLASENFFRKEFFRFILDKIADMDFMLEEVDINRLADKPEILELIFSILTPLLANEDELFWALGMPIPSKIFLSSNAFGDFFATNPIDKNLDGGLTEVAARRKKIIYNMILEKFYNFDSALKGDVFYARINPETKLKEYYGVELDSSFVEVSHKNELPKIDFEELSQRIQSGDELVYLEQCVPLDNFFFEGFNIISIKNVTLQHALADIRATLVNHNYQDEAYQEVIEALKIISGNSDLDFGLMPFLTVNNRLVFEETGFSKSKLIAAARKADLGEDVFYKLINNYIENPQSKFVRRITEENALNDDFLRVLKEDGVRSYAVIPVFYSAVLCGVVEIFSTSEVSFDDNLILKIGYAIPLIGQLFHYGIEEFNGKIESVLMSKFTVLQPAVQWKFNEAVWNYLRQNEEGNSFRDVEKIVFKHVYPLFGAIDVRDSTIERNRALKEDIEIHINLLIETLGNICSSVNLELTDKLLYSCNNWSKKINEIILTTEENQFTEFLENDVFPLFSMMRTNYPVTVSLLTHYFEQIDAEHGIVFKNRRALEISMQFINTKIGKYLDKQQKILQESFPCYFAKFRTDGVEYDIYIGQDIAPYKTFDLLYLKNIRLWQLTSMVEITRLTREIQQKIPHKLLTTQLIFVHSSAIDISFRTDERRFDVEGAYNIRYEVVKKRIDKVLIKDRRERLTQPDKIAIVYFTNEEAQEYIEYINYLTNEQLFNDDLEILELEELQGVAGLKALRVGVNYNRKL
ncbi:hypothetical protein ABIB40_000023 [Pedobacter sp. UYP30]|uniref:hypothetical protein n=1 Tax=Pedobacter sp. UYP30 TaxID=1756400 RepID=UPI00339212A6